MIVFVQLLVVLGCLAAGTVLAGKFLGLREDGTLPEGRTDAEMMAWSVVFSLLLFLGLVALAVWL